MRQPREDPGLPPAAAQRLSIRAQTLGDVADVLQVRARSWRAAYADLVPPPYLRAMGPTPDDVARAEERFRRLGKHVRAYVADVGSAIRGFVVAGPDRDVGRPTGEVWAIYVDPGSWGEGIGAALLSTAIAALREADHDPIILWVLEGNASARGFYEHSGFVPTGDRRYIELGAPIPEVRYVLRAGGAHKWCRDA